MPDFYDDDDAATNLIERRWFAASAQVKMLQSECAVMQEVMTEAAKAYRGARLRLEQLEALRDGLAERLAYPERPPRMVTEFPEAGRALSAA